MTRKTILLLLVVSTVALFIWGAMRQSARVNADRFSTDQSAYMDYARSLAETNFQFVGGRNRMPLYPALMSLFYKPDMSDDAFFEIGKNVGIAIGLLGLAVVYLVFSQVSRPVDALAGTLVAMFTVFVYKAPYFQAEVLFYTINLVLFYLLLQLVRKPQVRTAALAGLVGGVAHLTKASVLPAVLLAAAAVVVRGVLGLWRHRAVDSAPYGSSPSRLVLSHLSCALVLLGCFTLVIFPYIRTSKERFGQYFYNVNSTFYMWYDSWEEAKGGTRAHGDRVGWPQMPEDQIPSFQKYVREHSLAEITKRFTSGIRELRSWVIRSYGYAEFFMAYAVALVLLFIQAARRGQSFSLSRLHPAVLLFIVGYFIGYTLLYAWYTPIAGGDRLILSLFLPAMLIVVWALSHAQDLDLSFDLLGLRIAASSVSPMALLFLIAYVLTTFPLMISTLSGGG